MGTVLQPTERGDKMPRNTFVEGSSPYLGEYPESYAGQKETKSRALMQIIDKIVEICYQNLPKDQHYLVSKAHDLTKDVYSAKNETEVESALAAFRAGFL